MQACALKESECNTAHLIFFDSAIGFEFDAQDKLGRDSLDASRDLAHLVHALVNERVELFVNGGAPFPPLWRSQRLLDRFGRSKQLKFMSQRVFEFGLLLDSGFERLLQQADEGRSLDASVGSDVVNAKAVILICDNVDVLARLNVSDIALVPLAFFTQV